MSDHCPVILLQTLEVGFVNGQVLLAWSIALHTQELYTQPLVLKERWREEGTGSSSLSFFLAVFTRVVVESSQPPAAESMSPRKGGYHLQLVRSNLDFPLWSAIQGACSSVAPCTSVIRVLCQALEPSAFLVHPVLAAIAVAAHSNIYQHISVSFSYKKNVLSWTMTCSILTQWSKDTVFITLKFARLYLYGV